MKKNRISLTTSVIIAVILILVIGFFAFTTLKDNILGPTTSHQMNVTMATGNTVFNMLGTVLVIGAIVTILGLLFYWVSSPERYKKPNKLIKFLASSLYYFGFGLMGVAIVAIPAYLIYFLFNYTIVEGNISAFIEIGKWILFVTVAFFGIAGFGYIFKKKFIDKLLERRKELEYEKNITELPGVSE